MSYSRDDSDLYDKREEESYDEEDDQMQEGSESEEGAPERCRNTWANGVKSWLTDIKKQWLSWVSDWTLNLFIE